VNQSEYNLFQGYITKWRQHAGPSDEAHIADLVGFLYEDLGLERPEIVFCRGQLQHAIFPTIVFLVLKHGRARMQRFAFEHGSSESPNERAVWNALLKEALDCLVWRREAPLESGLGEVLQDSIYAWIKKAAALHAVSEADRKSGSQRREEWEKEFERELLARYQRIEQILLHSYIDQQHVWRGFVRGLPDDMLPDLEKAAHLPLTDRAFAMRGLVEQCSWIGGWDWYTLAANDFARECLDCKFSKEANKHLDHLVGIATGAAAYLFFEHCCFVYLKPLKLSLDEGGRLHNGNDAAAEFVDGTQLFAWHGIEVDDQIIKNPQNIRIKDIDDEPNIEMRRILIDRYGLEEYIRDKGARVVHSDRYGRLYRKDMPGDEPLVVVRVENSTREPDGSRKHYFLRVPPHITRAKEAVAWTFGLDSAHYLPKKET